MVFSLVWPYLIAFNLAYNKSKLYNTLDYWSRDMLNFDFLEKSGSASQLYLKKAGFPVWLNPTRCILFFRIMIIFS